MKKVKFETKREEFFESFFDNENCFENKSLSFANNTETLKLEESNTDKPKSFLNFLKQIFLFLPGTFILFFISMATLFILTDIITEPYRTLLFLKEPLRIFSIYIVGFSAIFMIWFGLGNLKDKKHFAIPFSVIVSGVIVAAIIKATENVSVLAEKIIHDFDYAICLLPIALIVPVLVKDLIDRKSKAA